MSRQLNPALELRKLKRSFEGDGALGYVVYRTLREAIVQGVLQDRDRLQDQAIARALKVSRTPVREALQRLETEGVLVHNPRSGLVVAELSSQDVEDIYAIRVVLEGLSARLAAERAAPSDIVILEELLRQMGFASLHKDTTVLIVLTKEFHKAIYHATRNPRLADILGRLHDAVQRFNWSTFGIEGRAQQATEEHRRLFDAIKARDPDLAEGVARKHMENTKRARLAMFPRQRTPRARAFVAD